MKRILGIVLILYISFSGRISAQDSLHISNLQGLIVSPKSPTISPVNVTHTLVVYFTIDKPDSVSNVYILIGNNMDNSCIANEGITIVKHGSIVCMHNSVTNFEISRFYGKSTKYEIVLTDIALNQLKYLTVYAKHKNNNYSQRAYFKIK